MRTSFVILALGGIASSADVFRLTDVNVTSQTQTTNTVFVSTMGDKPPNIEDKNLWTLVIHDPKTKLDTILSVTNVQWDASTHTLAITFSGLTGLDPLRVDWTATFNNILQTSAKAPKKSFFTSVDTKDDADVYLFGSFLAGYSTKPIYMIDAKVGWVPEIRETGYFLGVTSTLSTNADTNPPIDRTRVDPDAITGALALRRNIKHLALDFNPLRGEFSRKYPASDLVTAGTLKWISRPIYNRGQAVVLDPFVGYELGKNKNKPATLFDQSVDLTHYDTIARGVTGAHGAFLLFQKSPSPDAPYLLAIQGNYTARILAKSEPFVTTGFAGNKHVQNVSLGTNTRHYVECSVTYNASDLFGIEAKYKFGSLPPLFEFVEHQVVVGLTFKAKLPH